MTTFIAAQDKLNSQIYDGKYNEIHKDIQLIAAKLEPSERCYLLAALSSIITSPIVRKTFLQE